jgi:hypothetical protein
MSDAAGTALGCTLVGPKETGVNAPAAGARRPRPNRRQLSHESNDGEPALIIPE